MEQDLIEFLDKVFMLTAILVVGVLVFFVGEMFLQNKSVSLQNQNQITVSGEGKVYAKPDIATVSFGVTTQDTTVAAVTKTNTEQMNAVIAAIKKLGVDDKDIQTTNYNLSPVYENYTVPQPVPMMYPIKTGTKITGYKLEQDVMVKIRDFTKIGDIMSATTTEGANLVGGLQFTIDNPDQYKNQAEADAIKQAKANAQSMVNASGIQLGKLINVQEGGYYPQTYSLNTLKMGGGVAESAPSPVIQPGQQEIDVTVNLTYQVR